MQTVQTKDKDLFYLLFRQYQTLRIKWSLTPSPKTGAIIASAIRQIRHRYYPKICMFTTCGTLHAKRRLNSHVFQRPNLTWLCFINATVHIIVGGSPIKYRLRCAFYIDDMTGNLVVHWRMSILFLLILPKVRYYILVVVAMFLITHYDW